LLVILGEGGGGAGCGCCCRLMMMHLLSLPQDARRGAARLRPQRVLADSPPNPPPAHPAGRPTPDEEELTYGPDAWRHLEALEARAVGSIVTRKPVGPRDAEVAANARSRSAKLRVFERAGGQA